MIATDNAYDRPTLVDLVPCINSDESELLVDVLLEIGVRGQCLAGSVCQTLDRVQTAISLRTRGMVRIEEGVLELTPLGNEWATAFARLIPGSEVGT